MSHAPVKILDWGDMSGIEDLGPVALKGQPHPARVFKVAEIGNFFVASLSAIVIIHPRDGANFERQ